MLVVTLDLEFHGSVNTCFHFCTSSIEIIMTHSLIFLYLMPEQIDHPILITECVCNPVHSRSKMAELLFETYGVPSIGINTLLTLQ
jgi:actin-related protein